MFSLRLAIRLPARKRKRARREAGRTAWRRAGLPRARNGKSGTDWPVCKGETCTCATLPQSSAPAGAFDLTAPCRRFVPAISRAGEIASERSWITMPGTARNWSFFQRRLRPQHNLDHPVFLVAELRVPLRRILKVGRMGHNEAVPLKYSITHDFLASPDAVRPFQSIPRPLPSVWL